jgi:mannose-1-phosphate guanylyltransferase/phosphomannomutase
VRTTQAVILAGGKGTRLYPLTHVVPKPMVPVGGRPFLEHLVRLLGDAGVRDVVLLTGHLAEQIEDHFGDGQRFGVSVRYSREPTPLGTGGALRLAQPLLAERFFLLNGDTYLPTDWAAMDAALERSGATALLSAYANQERVAPQDNLAVDADGRVTAYDKVNPPAGANATDAGVSLFRSSVIDLLPASGPSALEEKVYQPLIDRGEIRAWWTRERFYDIGTPDRLSTIRSVLP